MSAVVSDLVQFGVAAEYSMVGCSDREIALVRSWNQSALPAAYEQFLRIMGRGAGTLFKGDCAFFETLRNLRDAAQELCAADCELPDDAVVVWMHEGYQFMFIRSSEGDDPPVYYYMEGRPCISRKYERFTEFLLAFVRDAVVLMRARLERERRRR